MITRFSTTTEPSEIVKEPIRVVTPVIVLKDRSSKPPRKVTCTGLSKRSVSVNVMPRALIISLEDEAS